MTTEQLKKGVDLEKSLAVLRDTLTRLTTIRGQWEDGRTVQVRITSAVNGYNGNEVAYACTSEKSMAFLVSTPIHMAIEAAEQDIKALEAELAAL